MRDWGLLDQQLLLPTYGRVPIVVKEAKEMYIMDEEGIPYLDLFSGLGVNILGHCHPQIIGEIQKQSSKFIHISNFFYNKPSIELAEKIISATYKGKIYFANSGAESTEAAIKYIYKYGKENSRRGIVVKKGSFHGRTLGALKFTRMEKIQQDFPMLDYPVFELNEEDSDEFREIMDKYKPAALLLEPISGSGGIHVMSIDFLEKAWDLCKKNNILFCLDEIQSGMGRTGKLFAYQHGNIKPDILLFGKGVGGGLPLAGILVRDGISSYFNQGDHGTTFAPNPIAAALGVKTLEILDKDLLGQVPTKEKYIIQKLMQLKYEFPNLIGQIRGKGLMIGVDILKNNKDIRKEFSKRKILINLTNDNVLRLLPALIIEKHHIDCFIHEFYGILTEWKDLQD